ncbi:MAG: hypothetical protein K6G30_09085 [Acetatifactor sp.]|nr:hypothetical protein [Acetatifactor sp.]
MRKSLCAIEKEYLLEMLRDFEDNVPMTRPERNALRRWVWGGHDINSNPWGYCCGDGWEMSYLEALRTDEEIYEVYYKAMAEER